MPYRVLVLILILVGAELTFSLHSPAARAQPRSAPELHWSTCRDVPDTECAGLEVPVDPARPDGAQFILRLGRVPATDPARKKGVLLFIPGGPGVGISGVFGQLRGLQHIEWSASIRAASDRVVQFVATQTPSLLLPSRPITRPHPSNSKPLPEPTRHSSEVASQQRAS